MGAEVDLPRCARRGFRGNCRPWAARITSAFRRAPRVPFRTDEKEPKVRLRTLRRVLRNLREYLARTRGLPPLPTGTPAEGSIQVAGAPNDGNGAASLPGRGTRGRVADPPPVRRTRIGLTDRGVSCGQGPQLTCALRSQQRTPEGSPGTFGGKQHACGVFARFARVRGFAAQFSASPWEMRASQKPPCLPYGNSRYGSGDSRAEVLRPRRGGWRDAVHPSVHPWQGAADFGRRPTGGGAGVKGAQPPAASFPHFLSVQEMGPPAGAGPGSFAAR